MLIDWFVESICNLQQKGEDLVVATVLKKSGSAPCLAGAKMILRPDGSTIGSVGGGALEAGVTKVAQKVASSRKARVLSFNLTGADAAGMQMICGGTVDVLVEHVACTPDNASVFQALRGAMASGEKCYFIAELGKSGEGITYIERSLVLENGTICGSPALDSDTVSDLKAMAFSSAYPVVADLACHRYFVERCFTPSTVYIFGAGHISQKLATLADMADFRVVVLDDRADFANRERFPDTDEIVVLDSFDSSFCSLEIDNDSYIVIVTRGHLHDATVLAQALGTKARYVGMMGSRKKREELFRKFLRDGFSEKDLERVRCPIGLDINAETQMEIAFSIVSQLILARTGGKKRSLHQSANEIRT